MSAAVRVVFSTMKALFVAVLLLAMVICIYKQRDNIAELQASLATEKQKNAQLEDELERTKKLLAAAAAGNRPLGYAGSLSNPHQAAPAPQASGSAATNWMWGPTKMDPNSSKLQMSGSHH